MAYVNVKDWSVDQVTEWLKGLDSVIAPYIKSFLNNGVKGHQLLSLRSDDLEHLGVLTIGHQEVILEAVEHLRNFHYELDRENLQMLALRLSCAANSLCKELQLTDENCTMVPTQTMSDVHNIIAAIKPLVCWLDRAPFRGDAEYADCKTDLLQLSLEMATSAHRDIFSEKPLRTIRNIAEKIAQLADRIVQEMSDPMILQPASLALATVKKKEQDIGFYLLPKNTAVHQIAEIKYGSPAHTSSKIEEGDEIVQVNYQTVVGWQRKKLLLLLQESPPEIVLTLKKRPRHTKVYGQIYMKPYRLPSKKRATPYSRWNDNLPSPQLLAMPDLPQILPPSPKPVKSKEDIKMEVESCNSSDSEPLDGRVYPLKPHPVLQRRNTIAEDTPMSKRPHQAIEQYYQLLKNQAASKHSSSYNIPSNKYEDESMHKSASCSDGLEISRPRTVIGLSSTKTKASSSTDFKGGFQDKSFSRKKRVNFEECQQAFGSDNKTLVNNLNVSVNSLSSANEIIDFIDEGVEITDRSDMKTEWQKQIVEEIIDTIHVEGVSPPPVPKDTALNDVHVHNIIKKFDEQLKPKVLAKTNLEKPPQLPQKRDLGKKPIVPPKAANRKMLGQISKSHSTPAYDQTNENETLLPLLSPKSRDVYDTTNLTNKTIKYELGIPLVEGPASIPPFLPTKTLEKPYESTPIKKNTYEDIPPKPPPRNLPQEPPQKPNRNLPEPPTPTPRQIQHSNSSLVETIASSLSTKLKLSTEHLEARNFESTPVSKTKDQEDLHNKNDNIPGGSKAVESKISPTNSVVRAMIYSNKSKAKKKNNLIGKRRKVSVKDVSPGEIQGYLYQRLRTKQCQNAHWEKRWFVLNSSYLYGFTSKDSTRAKCLIFLSGFTVSIATEVKSRSNAFKVYHTGTVFYFSTEDSESLTSWIELITAATLVYDNLKTGDSLYSESDESDLEKKSTGDKSNESIRKFGSLKKFATGKSGVSPQNGSSSLDRKWFFNKSNSIYKNSQPVPTAQFRSYRKITSMSMSTGNFVSHIPDFVSGRLDAEPEREREHEREPKRATPPAIKLARNKPKPYNYVYASNPNLCDISDLHTLRNFQKQPFQPPDNFSGFVTLEELMNKQAEEQKLNPHLQNVVPINPKLVSATVVYGEVPLREPKENVKKSKHSRNFSDCSVSKLKEEAGPSHDESKNDSTSFCFGKRSGSIKKQSKKDSDVYQACTYPKLRNFDDKFNRSLPRTHRLVDSSLKKSEERKSGKFASSKEYSASSMDLLDSTNNEMVYCPQKVNDVQFAQNRMLDGSGQRKIFKLNRQHSLTSADKKEHVKLKSAIQYTPMSLPLCPDPKNRLNPKLAFELNLDEKVTKTGKLRSFFGKQDGKRDKSFLGSPKLQRAVHDKNSRGFQVGWPSEPLESVDTSYSMEDLVTGRNKDTFSAIMNTPTIDYPGLEYPPVFEPETYSLADPQCSITLLKKQDKK